MAIVVGGWHEPWVLGAATAALGLGALRVPLLAWFALTPLAHAAYTLDPPSAACAALIAGAAFGISGQTTPMVRRLMPVSMFVMGVSFAAAFGAIGAALPLIEACSPRVGHWLPSGIAFGIGMYLTPDFTLPRVIGALCEIWWRRRYPHSHAQLMLMVASGFMAASNTMDLLDVVPWSIANT